MFRFLLLSLFLASTITAFQSSVPFKTSLPKVISSSSTTARYIILSDEETEKIISTAQECAEGECSIDDVEGLIYELKEQQKEMEARLEKIMNMVSHLQHLNEQETRDQNQVRSFVKDLLRVFAHEETKKAKFNPVGFAGDIGSGAKTAYDVLPPKKWKPSA